MDYIINPHDKFFKETLGNISVAQEFIYHYLPDEILGIIELETLHLQKDSFVAEDLKEYFSDLLFSTTMNGEEGFLYFLFEHKSYADKNISFQLLTYMIEIWESKWHKEEYKELPFIIPVVIYHGREKWNIAKSFADQLIGYHALPKNIQKYILNFEYLFYDFSLNGKEELKGENELRIFLQILKYIFSKDTEQITIVIEMASEGLVQEQLKHSFYYTLVTYILNARDDLSIDEVKERLSVEGRKKFMSVADQLRREGREEGRKEGKREVAKRLLQLNMAEDQIIAATGLSKEDIKRIKNNVY